MSGALAVDLRQVRRGFARAAAGYTSAAVIPREIGSRMLERLDYVKIEPGRVLDLGCGAGASLTALCERYPKALVTGVDVSEPMLRAGRGPRSRLHWLLPFVRGHAAPLLASDACALPLKAAVLDLVWSNLMLHWLDDPLLALREVHRTLTVGGLFMFSTFGPDTLKELRAVFNDAYPHTQHFVDMHDYGDMLVESGFADPVMDVEVLTVTYASFDDLVRELRANGATCARLDRRRGLTGRALWQDARARYDARIRDGRLPVTLEVVYGHAWKAAPKKTADGRDIIRFDPKARAS